MPIITSAERKRFQTKTVPAVARYFSESPAPSKQGMSREMPTLIPKSKMVTYHSSVINTCQRP
jgi:hypothetical protein